MEIVLVVATTLIAVSVMLILLGVNFEWELVQNMGTLILINSAGLLLMALLVTLWKEVL